MHNKKLEGYFEYVIGIDCETTGIAYGNDDPSVGHQAVSWGVVVANTKDLIPIEKIYVEIKYNEQSIERRNNDKTFGVEAANIHGLSYAYLEANGVDEREAVSMIGSLLVKYWGTSSPINVLGHNVRSFDVPFLISMFRRYDININISHRNIDTNSIGFATVGSYTSNSLFNCLGLQDRGVHNALDDAELSLEACRRIKLLWDAKLGISANL